MLETLLRTKLYAPPLHPSLVPRPRLVGRLNDGLRRGCPLTLISAPAGFGKTTLILEWLGDLRTAGGTESARRESGLGQRTSKDQLGPEVAWLSLDKSDNDPVRFLTYLVAALQTVKSGLGESALTAFHTSEKIPLETVITLLINEIDDFLNVNAVNGGPLMVVLDDYHLIEAEPIHRMLTFILEHPPKQMYVVLATRVVPPLPLARLRGRGHLNELIGDDLRFTPDEVGHFLSQVMGLRLPQTEMANLAEHSEGWIAGLQMAALSLRAGGQKPSGNVIDALVGDNRFVTDYLLEEVLRQQPAEIQSFLLHTSLLPRLTGSLCDAITGQQDGQRTLSYLERVNLFVSPLDNERRWYRYHQLFAELLRQQLMRSQPDVVADLHCRASQWYEEHHLISQAIDHALASGDVERGLDLAEQAAEATLSRSEVATFLAWMDALPEDMLLSRPRLFAFCILGLILAGRPVRQIETRLSRAEREHGPSIELTLNRAVLATTQGNGERAITLSRSALEQMPDGRPYHRNLALRTLAAGLRIQGDVMAAISAAEAVARDAKEYGDTVGMAIAAFQMAGLRLVAGKPREARSLCEQALSYAVDSQGRRLPISVRIMGLLGDLQREANDLEGARKTLEMAIQLAKRWTEIWALGAYLILARVRQADGDQDGARQAFKQAERLAVTYDVTEVDDRVVAAYMARLWLWQDNLQAARRWAVENGLNADLGTEVPAGKTDQAPVYYYVHEIEQTTLARLYLAEGQVDKALAVLTPLAQNAQRLQRMGILIEVDMLNALSFSARDEPEEALAALERSLALAEPEGYVRLFVDEGAAMQKLLRSAVSRDIYPVYVGKLLKAFDLPDTTLDSSGKIRQPLLEPLSQREMQVLRLLQSHLNAPEIAQELTVSVHTVRFHIKNIYSKLGVHSRSDAVGRAVEIGLF